MNRHFVSLVRLSKTIKGSILLGISTFLIIVGLSIGKATAQSAGNLRITQTAAAQIQALVQEKQSRTPSQRKINSAILHTLKARRGDELLRRVPELNTFVKVDSEGKVRVNIKTNAPVTPELLQKITATGAEVLVSVPNYNAIQVLVPLTQVESLANFSEVRSIRPYIKPMTRTSKGTIPEEREPLPLNDLPQASQNLSNKEPAVQRLSELSQVVQRLAAVPGQSNTGSVTSEGDIAHGAALARATYGVDGTGVKIGVLSDSYDNLKGAATDIANGDLPPEGVTLAGSGDLRFGGVDEGRAMLQIIHDLAPGAQLYFATAFKSEEDFANNIRALRAAGCDIIVDDVIYLNEPVFQDGIIAQAVNDVTTSGALYFSAAGNEGNKNDNTSGLWEGNFVDGGPAPLRLPGQVHSFGSDSSSDPNSSPSLSNRLTDESGPITVQWSDPIGQSANDYDIYVLNSQGTAVIGSSDDIQDGNDDPFEIVNPQRLNSQVIVVQYSGQPRFLNLNTNRGRLAINTRGQVWGHAAAVNAISVAAVNAQGVTSPFVGGAANPVETFSSDGPRRIFYKADGTPITPDNFLDGGGVVRPKPNIAAADGVMTTLPSNTGLNPFFGTSAAAPHAAAVAALLKSFRPSLTPAQTRIILNQTALDIEATGVDQDSGHGIVMADRALQRAAESRRVSP